MFKHVNDLIDFMVMSAVVEMFNSECSDIPFYKGNQFGVPSVYKEFEIKKFELSFEKDRIVYKIYV